MKGMAVMNQKIWPSILKTIVDHFQVIALFGLGITGCFSLAFTGLQSTQLLIALAITQFVLLASIFLVIWLAKAQAIAPLPTTNEHTTGTGCICEVLPNREAMYKKCSELVGRAKEHILDTTWGPAAPEPAEAEKTERDKYIAERVNAKFRRVACREIIGPGKHLDDRALAAQTEQSTNAGYKFRRLGGHPRTESIPDFMVVDSKYVLLSHVDADHTPSQNKYIVIESPCVAGVFTSWFDECFRPQ